jgi:hypothetical protein
MTGDGKRGGGRVGAACRCDVSRSDSRTFPSPLPGRSSRQREKE